MTSIMTMTPPQIDKVLAELGAQFRAAAAAANDAVENMHRALGEKARDTRSGKTWPTTSAEAIELCRERIAAPDYRETPWGTSPTKAVNAYDAAIAAMQASRDAAAPYEAEFSRRGGWTRFYLVTSSDGGHIHSSTNCSTCYITTGFGWLTELSGLNEQDAVDAHGPLLCTVCYPSAPAEWTCGKAPQTADEAEAEGKCINKAGTDYRRVGMSTYGNCPVCGARGVAATATGLRKHTHERKQIETQRAARLADPKLMCTPSGDELKIGYDVFRTVRTAEIAYVDAMFWAASSSRPAFVEEHQAKAAVLIEALAAKYGTTVDEARARLAKRVAAKGRRY